MSSALEKWEQLVCKTIAPESIMGFVSEQPLNLLIAHSADLAAQIKKQLRSQVFAFASEKAMELFVQQHQSVFIRLLDTLEKYKSFKGQGPLHKKLYAAIGEQLGAVLGFIEHYFPKYFNLDEPVPLPYFKLAHKELCTLFESCRKLLQKHSDRDGELAETICSFLSEFCTNGETAVSYRSLIYYKELFCQLMRLQDKDTNGNLYSPLVELLVYLNFNSASFISYCTGQIEKETAEKQDVREKIEMIARHKKQLGQLQVKPGFALHPELPPARDQITACLAKEIDYLKTVHPLLGGGPFLTPADAPPYRDLVHISFRAPEIYLFCKAFVDAGGAPTETYSSLLEKTAPYLSNKRQKGFSPESLIKASDKVNPESRDNVRRFLQRMMRNIESYD